ncbi:unnamed protein product, partial [Mesorhabditis spiculigera]
MWCLLQSDEPPTRIFHAAHFPGFHPSFSILVVKNSPSLVAIILSAPEDQQIRDAIRQQWASANYSQKVQDGDVEVMFVLSQPLRGYEMDSVAKEAQIHGDLIVTNLAETYENLLYKVVPQFPQMYCKTWVRSMPKRDASSKWFVAGSQWKRKYFPTYCDGPAYVLSANAVPGMLEAISEFPPIFIEDVFYTGVVAERLRIRRNPLDRVFHHTRRSLERTQVACSGKGLPLLATVHPVKGAEKIAASMTITKLTPGNQQKLVELRRLVKNHLTEYYDTDFNLLRWLQGHDKLEVEEISRKLIHHLEMRKCHWNLDLMHAQSEKHPINNYWVNGVTCLAGEKLPNTIVFVEQCGKTDYYGMLQNNSLSEVMKARLPILEDMLHRCQQASILFVMDLTDIKYDKKLYDLVTGKMKELAEFMADHYVEMVKYFVVVNVPAFIWMLWTAVKPLLPERTKNKVRLLSSDWRQEILELCNEKACPDYWSNSQHKFYASIPTPLKFDEMPNRSIEEQKLLEQDADLEEASILPGRNLIIRIECRKGDRLSYWITANRCLGFGIFQATEGETLDELYK